MSCFKETIYVNRDNAIRLLLLEDGVAFATAFPDVTPTKWELTIGTDTYDSDANPEAFDWDAADSTLELRLGALIDTELDYTATKLVVYAAEWPLGLVWLHPTTTPDQLCIRVIS